MSADLCVPESADVSLGKIESELARRLKMSQEPGESPVHRARMSNLIVYCDGPERSEEVEALLPAVVRIHPARVLKLVGDDRSGSSDVHASVMVRKAGHEVQLCSEQVTLHGGSHSREHLPFAVRSLLIGDLPTNVWWASKTPPPLAGPILDDLAEHAQQVVYDSLGWADPHRGVGATAPWLSRFERNSADGRWRVASDLNWRRLKYWRRIIAQALAPAAAPGALESVSEILVEHGPHAVTLAWQARRMDVVPARLDDPGEQDQAWPRDRLPDPGAAREPPAPDRPPAGRPERDPSGQRRLRHRRSARGAGLRLRRGTALRHPRGDRRLAADDHHPRPPTWPRCSAASSPTASPTTPSARR
jgi:glucose-6-phosphate dehydrogenase assembly protein OpcA